MRDKIVTIISGCVDSFRVAIKNEHQFLALADACYVKVCWHNWKKSKKCL